MNRFRTTWRNSRQVIANRLSVRIIASMILGIILATAISEVSFRLQENSSRSPMTVVLVIPEGTAEKISLGDEVSLPGSLTFVVGDTLKIINQDTTAHTLGPLYVPANASANLVLEQPESLAYTCSFQPTKFLNLDVKEALTLSTRVKGILLAGIPLGTLLALYSLAAWPLKAAHSLFQEEDRERGEESQ